MIFIPGQRGKLPSQERAPGGFPGLSEPPGQRLLRVAVPIHGENLEISGASPAVRDKCDVQAIRAPAWIPVLTLGGQLNEIIATDIDDGNLEHTSDFTG